VSAGKDVVNINISLLSGPSNQVLLCFLKLILNIFKRVIITNGSGTFSQTWMGTGNETKFDLVSSDAVHISIINIKPYSFSSLAPH
jgi:hypothetical protein